MPAAVALRSNSFEQRIGAAFDGVVLHGKLLGVSREALGLVEFAPAKQPFGFFHQETSVLMAISLRIGPAGLRTQLVIFRRQGLDSCRAVVHRAVV